MRPASEAETDMTCRELTDFLVDHVEGRLPTAVAAEFEGHLAQCPSCGAYLGNCSATIRLGRASVSYPTTDRPKRFRKSSSRPCSRPAGGRRREASKTSETP